MLIPLTVLSEYLTRKELADQLSRTVRTLERWEVRRIGPPITRVGKTPMYRIDSVHAWLKSQEEKPVRASS